MAIYFLQQQLPPHAERFVDQTLAVADPAISVITEIALLCWKHASQEDLLELREFIADATVFELSDSIKRQTAEVRESHRMKLSDAIIAATALTYDLTLLTSPQRGIFSEAMSKQQISPQFHEQTISSPILPATPYPNR